MVQVTRLTLDNEETSEVCLYSKIWYKERGLVKQPRTITMLLMI